MTLAIGTFFFSLSAIAVLFGLKQWEMRRERAILSAWRQKADVRALRLKELLDAARIDIKKIPPQVVLLSRIGIHQFALAFAAFARSAERYAHRLADLVSYKHRFEKRDTRSEFLKKVSEHKGGSGLDTTADNGHNT